MQKSDSHTSSSFSPSYTFRCPHSAPTKPSPPDHRHTRASTCCCSFTETTRFIGQFHRVNTSRLSLVVLIFNILVPVEPEITVSPDPDQHLQVLPILTDGIALPVPSYHFGTANVHSKECRFNRICYNYFTAGLSHMTTTSMTI